MKKIPLLSLRQAFINAIAVLAVMLVCAPFVTITQVHAQSSEIEVADETDSDLEQDSPVNDSEVAADTAENKPAPKVSKPSEPNGVFIPSEELSEDTSAPFPVDI